MKETCTAVLLNGFVFGFLCMNLVSGAEMDICNRFFRLYVAADMTDAEVDPLCGMLVVPSCTL